MDYKDCRTVQETLTWIVSISLNDSRKSEVETLSSGILESSQAPQRLRAHIREVWEGFLEEERQRHDMKDSKMQRRVVGVLLETEGDCSLGKGWCSRVSSVLGGGQILPRLLPESQSQPLVSADEETEAWVATGQGHKQDRGGGKVR